MIGPFDRVRLPEGVELRDGALVDVLRPSAVPVNPTALIALDARTPHEAAAALERRYGVDAEAALRDVLSLFAELNARFLLNVSPRWGVAAVAWRWLRTLPALLPVGRLPTTARARRSVDTSSARSLARTAPAALAPFVALLLAAGTTLSALLLTAFAVNAPTLFVTLGVAIAAVVALHELAHLAALHGVPACIVVRGFRASVVHRAISPRRTRVVAASGPVAGLALALCLVAVTCVQPSAEGAAAALVCFSNALGLTVVSRDGRTRCGLPRPPSSSARRPSPRSRSALPSSPSCSPTRPDATPSASRSVSSSSCPSSDAPTARRPRSARRSSCCRSSAAS